MKPKHVKASDGTWLTFPGNTPDTDIERYMWPYENGQDVFRFAPHLNKSHKIAITAAKNSSKDTSQAAQTGIGNAVTGLGMRTQTKRGGVGGGGRSGPVTSPASRAARSLTGNARIKGVSVGGRLGRALPVIGPLLMLKDFYDLTTQPNDEPDEIEV